MPYNAVSDFFAYANTETEAIPICFQDVHDHQSRSEGTAVFINCLIFRIFSKRRKTFHTLTFGSGRINLPESIK